MMGGPIPPMTDQMRELARAFQNNDPRKHELTKGLTSKQVYRAMSPFALLDDPGHSEPVVGNVLHRGLRMVQRLLKG